MPTYVHLTEGDPAPWFVQRTASTPQFAMDVTAGRYLVLCFFASASDPHAMAAIEAVRTRRSFFNDMTACFFGISNDANDESQKRVADEIPGYRYLWDFDASASRLYGAAPRETDQPVTPRRLWVVLDPMLRVLKVVPFATDRSDIANVLAFLARLPAVDRFAGTRLHAPVLMLPNIFEPALCRLLVDLFEKTGGEESGFMREIDGRTVAVHDYGHKRRRDIVVQDQELIKEIQTRFRRRVVPMIQRAHQFTVTRMERYIVSRYSGEDGGHFRPHRDNTTKGTAHRRFAVSVNLNDDFDGGDISFPEFSREGMRPPIGAGLVFSCSLLHAVSAVTRGRRYAFLPFLYDDEAARIREANVKFLEDGTASYSAG